jgi:hypothetical protein
MLNEVKPPPDPSNRTPAGDVRHEANPNAEAVRRTSESVQAGDSARQSPVADVGVYDRPNTNRASLGNIGLSAGVGIVLVILVLIMFAAIFW